MRVVRFYIQVRASLWEVEDGAPIVRFSAIDYGPHLSKWTFSRSQYREARAAVAEQFLEQHGVESSDIKFIRYAEGDGDDE